MNKWIKGLGIIGSENEGTKQRREPSKRNMPRGKNNKNKEFLQYFRNTIKLITP